MSGSPPETHGVTIEEALTTLDQIADGTHEHAANLGEVTRHIATAMRLTLAGAAPIAGECEAAVPFSPLHLVAYGKTVQWCCNHVPRHCYPT